MASECEDVLVARERRFLYMKEFNTPEDRADATFLDAFVDISSPPDALVLMRPDYGFMARVRDGHRIGGYMRRAAMELGVVAQAHR